MRKKGNLVRAALAAAALAAPAYGQGVRDEAQRLLEERRARERLEQLDRRPPAVKGAGAVEAASASASDEPAFPVSDIVLEGDVVLPEARRRDILAPFLGRRLGPRGIDGVLRAVTAAYLELGYVTTRAYLGPQNLASGHLVVTVIPGRIERVSVDGETGALPPVEAGEPLRLADLEQAVDQINRLRSRRAEAQIAPGQTPGASVVVVNTRPVKPWRTGLGVDNFGQSATGERRQRVTAEYDNLFGLWDAWALTGVQSADARSELLAVSVPAGYGTASYAYAQSNSRVPLAGIAVNHTESRSHTLGWNQVVARGQQARHALDLTLALRDLRRRIDDLALTPQQQTSLRAAASSLFRFAPGSVSAEIGYTRGLPRFGGDADLPGLPRSAPHNEFGKWDLHTGATWSLGADWAWRGSLIGQAARTGLPGAEQLFLGGSGSVRGFKEAIVSADRGLLMRHELQWTGPLARASAAAGDRFDPFVFFDYARARLLADAEDRRRASAGAGLRAVWKAAIADLAWARPLTAPAGARREGRLHFSLSLQF
jgi:hemolysin activation/secretion protein